jgi:2-polyprenyl-3-methyl-5-hydroxy-6-metoxy-1,4-benzoquinol methylase
VTSTGVRASCDVCGGSDLESLHRQTFILPGDQVMAHDVVACRACGFAFARNISSTEDYETYYAANRKYTYEGSRNVSESLRQIHKESFRMVNQFLDRHSPPFAAKETRIADIGCSTGDLLSLFKSAGYCRLTGVDPAPECREIALRLYGIEIETSPLSRHRADSPYDVILLSSVLEHLPNPLESLEQVSRSLSADGVVFVQVPDADNFGAQLVEPYLEFSIEHINYFTATSLANLMRQGGFGPEEIRHDVLIYNGTAYPAITSLWRSNADSDPRVQVSDVSPIRAYVARCQEKLKDFNARLKPLIEARSDVVIWGVGSLTSRLLATTRLGEVPIAFFVDSNSAIQGKQIAGRKILAPDSLRSGVGTVLISSYVYAEEIRRTLVDDLRFRGTIISL